MALKSFRKNMRNNSRKNINIGLRVRLEVGVGVTIQALQQHLNMRIYHIVVYTLDAICSIYALFGGGRAIGESLIFHFEIPDFGEG